MVTLYYGELSFLFHLIFYSRFMLEKPGLAPIGYLACKQTVPLTEDLFLRLSGE